MSAAMQTEAGVRAVARGMRRLGLREDAATVAVRLQNYKGGEPVEARRAVAVVRDEYHPKGAARREEDCEDGLPPLEGIDAAANPDASVRVALDPAAFHGILGEITEAIRPTTEASDAAILSQLIVCIGSVMGRGTFFTVEDTPHHLNFFVVLVGATGKARKGTSFKRALSLVRRVDPGWALDRVLSGMSSGEGLIHATRDARGNPGEEDGDPGVADKRLLCIEEEMAGVLRLARREGNILSPIIRQAWDGGTLNTLTKGNPERATDAHISVIGHITEDELRRELQRTDVGNGFANRFLWMRVERARYLPDGGGLAPATADALAAKLCAAIRANANLGRMRFDPDAAKSWRASYPMLSEGKPGLLGAVVGRAEAQVVRLATMYASLDGCLEIGMPHLEAARAVWRYAEDSARAIFGDSFGDPVTDRILKALGAKEDGLKRSDIYGMFGNHVTASAIEEALSGIERAKKARKSMVPTSGRPVEVWHDCR